MLSKTKYEYAKARNTRKGCLSNDCYWFWFVT